MDDKKVAQHKRLAMTGNVKQVPGKKIANYKEGGSVGGYMKGGEVKKDKMKKY